MALKIGELLISKGMLDRSQLDKALENQRTFGGKLGTNLVELGFVKDTDLALALAEQLRMPAAKLEDFGAIARSAVDLVPKEFAKAHRLMPLRVDHRLHVAICDPGDIVAIDELKFKSGRSVQASIAPELWIIAAHERYYNISREARFVKVGESEEAFQEVITHDISTDVAVDYEGKYEKLAVDLPLPVFLKRLAQARTKEEIFGALLDYLARFFPRMAVYVTRKDHFGGWIVRGLPVRPQEFGAVRISAASESPLRTVLTTRRGFRGEVGAERAREIGFDLLRIPFEEKVRLQPVLFRGQAIAILLGVPDGGGRRLGAPEDRLIETACERAGMAIEMIALARRILEPPAPA